MGIVEDVKALVRKHTNINDCTGIADVVIKISGDEIVGIDATLKIQPLKEVPAIEKEKPEGGGSHKNPDEEKKPRKPAKYKKVNAGGSKYSMSREYTTSDEDMKIVRKHVTYFKRKNGLSENQLKALSTIPKKAKELDEVHRRQLLDIFNDVKGK